MMFKRVLLLLLLVAVMVGPGSADLVIYDETFTWSDSDVFQTRGVLEYYGEYYYPQSDIYMVNNLVALEPIQLMAQAPANRLKPGGQHSSGAWDVTFTSGGKVIGSGEYYYFQYYVGSTLYTQSVVDFIDVNWAGVVSGKISMSAPPTGYGYALGACRSSGMQSTPYDMRSTPSGYAGCFWDGKHSMILKDITFSTTVTYDWANRVRITVNDDSFDQITRFDLIRDAVPGYQQYSSLYITDAQNYKYTSVKSTDNELFMFLPDRYPLDLRLNTHLNHWFNTTIPYPDGISAPGAWVPCTINVYDADTRLPLSGDWNYYIVMRGYDSLNESASGASAVVNLPVTSILQPHLLRVTKEGYEQTSPLAFDVPAGGREVNVYLTPSETTAPEGSLVVTFVVTDIETGTPRGQCLVNVDGVGKYAGASGSVWFVLPENTTHQWLVTAEGYWPIGGNFTLGVDDLVIPVEMTKKTSELPRPPMPGIPGLPVIHPIARSCRVSDADFERADPR